MAFEKAVDLVNMLEVTVEPENQLKLPEFITSANIWRPSLVKAYVAHPRRHYKGYRDP